MKRRNLLLGSVALGFGTSGIIASGAFGNEESDERGNWIVTDDTDESSNSEVRVETIAELDSGSERFEQLDVGDVSLTHSSVIQQGEDGFLQDILFDSINDDAITRVGRVDSHGVVDPTASAFVIANVSGVGREIEGRTVELDLQLYDDNDVDSRAPVDAGDAVQFYYTIPDRDQTGENQSAELLTEGGVEVSPREFLCVAIEINSGRLDDFGQIESVGLTVREPNNSDGE